MVKETSLCWHHAPDHSLGHPLLLKLSQSLLFLVLDAIMAFLVTHFRKGKPLASHTGAFFNLVIWLVLHSVP